MPVRRIVFVVLCLASLCSVAATTITHLESFQNYLATPDPAYAAGSNLEVMQLPDLKIITTQFTSLKWLPTDKVSPQNWRHWMIIAIPDYIQSKSAFFYIGSGKGDESRPTSPHPIVMAMAQKLGMIGIELRNIPSQPIDFGDSKPRIEDDLVAYGWRKYLDTRDWRWVPQGPMLKATKTAMTYAQEIIKQQTGKQVDQFVVSGASKRGWVSWLTGIFDKRVKAIIPLVIDLVNVQKSMAHHHEVYGFWAAAIQDYVKHGVTSSFKTSSFTEMMKLIDPIRHVDKLTMPKLIINAANDEFFLPDSSQFYFSDLKGQKALRYIPNIGHHLDKADYIETAVAFVSAVERGVAMPSWSAKLQNETTMNLNFKTRPRAIILWEAHSPTKRDFRLNTKGYPHYKPTVLKHRRDKPLKVKVKHPKVGWKAWFVEMEFSMGSKENLKLTTAVNVVGAAN